MFADLTSGPLAHLPSGHFPANAAWLALAAICHNLTRAAGTLAGGSTPGPAARPSAASSSTSPPASPATAAATSPSTSRKTGTTSRMDDPVRGRLRPARPRPDQPGQVTARRMAPAATASPPPRQNDGQAAEQVSGKNTTPLNTIKIIGGRAGDRKADVRIQAVDRGLDDAAVPPEAWTLF